LQYAVLIGIGMSVLLYVGRQSQRVVLKRWSINESGAVTEEEAPAQLGRDEIVVLRPYGSLFFAAAPLFEETLPEVTPDSRHSAVIVTLRGKEDLGSTFLAVVVRYAEMLHEAECILMISGASDRVLEQFEKTEAMSALGSDRFYARTPAIAESTQKAMRDAQDWIDAQD
jgi:SulP family sulfate permease